MLPIIKHDEATNYILCPICGCPTKPNEKNLCLKCLSSEIDITSEIIKKNGKLTIKHCDSCKRWYNNNTSQWKTTEIGSPDLKDILLRKIKGLHKKENKILKSSFISTEESHSNIITIEIHLQKNIMFDDEEKYIKIEKIFCMEFKIQNAICKECKISTELHSSWKSCVQIIQNNVNNKRILLYLEQLLIKHQIIQKTNCIEIEQVKHGMNFYFDKMSMSRSFMNHLKDIIAINTNNKNCAINNIEKYKVTYYVELPCINNNDLCLIPVKLQKKCGGFSPLMVCYKISSSLHFIEPTSAHKFELDSKQYFRYNFKCIASVDQLRVFYVLNVIPIKGKKEKLWEIELVRFEDLGENEEVLECITNLNGIKDGDMVKGYDINKFDLFGNEMKKFGKKHKIPDVIIIEKYYDGQDINILNEKKRKWRLKRIDGMRMTDNYKMDEIFLNQIKMHKHLRAQINIYKNEKYDDNDDEQKNDDEDDIDDKELIKEISSDNIKQ